MDPTTVSIIIPQFECVHLTEQCLDSLFVHHDVSPLEILVVDDGSWQSVGLEQIPLRQGVMLLQQRHRGISAAWNHGARCAHGDFLIFLNNDTFSTGPWIESLIAPLQSREALMTGCLWRDETSLDSSILEELPTRKFLEGYCWAVRRDEFFALGGIYEALQLYWSDTDFQLRLKRVAGAAEPRLKVDDLPLVHLGHQTTRQLSDRCRQWLRDRQRFLKRWHRPAKHHL